MLWVLYVLVALWMALWFVPYSVNGVRPLPECIALIPMLTVPLVLVMGASAVTGHWLQWCIGVPLLLVQLMWFGASRWNMPRFILHLFGFSERRRRARADSSEHSDVDASHQARSEHMGSISLHQPHFKVMSLNCRFGRADAAELLTYVQSEHIDVLALQEVTEELIERLDKAGIGLDMPYRSLGRPSPQDNGGTNALFSRVKPVEQSAASVDILAANIPTLCIEIAGKRVRFASAHPKSPGRGGRFWQIGIERLAGFSKRITSLHEISDISHEQAFPSYSPSPQDTVVMGDLNSSIYHPVFRHLIRTSGLSDAAYEMRAGLHPTFPSSWRYVPSILEIDHVLLTEGVVPQSISTAIIPGSDHRALIVAITLS
ncbi:endonuclease/exonuclease/phosphatase family protein [Bifidobacterium aquikefiricola]|uniref:Endonuclease/exonuclease/phosphatase family protein n=1 Tax=Bifidobacterium aquikefiricola TaxID=3059038 RepID=A0AB39U7R3_9BIFI